NADFQRGRSRINSLSAELIEDRQHITRRHHDDLWREIADELHLPLRLPAGHGDDRAAQAFRAVMRAEAAGEEPVAVGHMHLHPRPSASGADRARDKIAPIVEIALRIANDRGLAGSA